MSDLDNLTERYVLVTTAYRGVFAGYAKDTIGSTVQLRQGRNCVYWSQAMKGFLGLATEGPDKDCRIGPAADIELREVTSVVNVSETARQRWEQAPWG